MNAKIYNPQASLELWQAAEKEEFSLAELEYYLKKGANVNFSNTAEGFHGNTTFMLLLDQRIFDYIKKAGIDFINTESFKIFKRFLEEGVEVNAPNLGGYTAGHWLVSWGNYESSAFLSNPTYGFDFFIPKEDGEDAIETAIGRERFSSLLGLLENLDLAQHFTEPQDLDKYFQVFSNLSFNGREQGKECYKKIQEARIQLEKKFLTQQVAPPNNSHSDSDTQPNSISTLFKI